MAEGFIDTIEDCTVICREPHGDAEHRELNPILQGFLQVERIVRRVCGNRHRGVVAGSARRDPTQYVNNTAVGTRHAENQILPTHRRPSATPRPQQPHPQPILTPPATANRMVNDPAASTVPPE